MLHGHFNNMTFSNRQRDKELSIDRCDSLLRIISVLFFLLNIMKFGTFYCNGIGVSSIAQR